MGSANEVIVVHGNGNLAGEVAVSGAKNSALKLMAASVLGRGVTTLRNVPLIDDIDVMGRCWHTLVPPCRAPIMC